MNRSRIDQLKFAQMASRKRCPVTRHNRFTLSYQCLFLQYFTNVSFNILKTKKTFPSCLIRQNTSSFTEPNKKVTVQSLSSQSQSRLINTMTALDAWTVMTWQQEERTGSGGNNMQIREAVMGKTARWDKSFPSQMKYRLKTLTQHERTDNSSRRRLHVCSLKLR